MGMQMPDGSWSDGGNYNRLPFQPQMYGQPQWQQRQPQMNPNQQMAAQFGGRNGLGNPFNDPWGGMRGGAPDYARIFQDIQSGNGMNFPQQGGPMQGPNAKAGGMPQPQPQGGPAFQGLQQINRLQQEPQGGPAVQGLQQIQQLQQQLQQPQTSSWSSQGAAPTPQFNVLAGEGYRQQRLPFSPLAGEGYRQAGGR